MLVGGTWRRRRRWRRRASADGLARTRRLVRALVADGYTVASGLAAEHLVISQVPLRRYEAQDWRRNRAFFPARNATLAALTQATIVVEVSGETSGTLIQARAAVGQGRCLFVLDSCFRDGAAWAAGFVERRAVRVRTFDDIRARLGVALGGNG